MNFDFLKDKRILVTGHTGFKGSWLCKILKMNGAKAYGYSLWPQFDSTYFKIGIKECMDKECIADIQDFNHLKSFINEVQPEVIFHLAAQPLVRRSYLGPQHTFQVNAMGTLNVLQCVKDLELKCNVICITTDKVYQNNEIGLPFKETDPLGGYDPYSASKACAEIVIDSYRKSFFSPNDFGVKHNVQLASVRAGNVIGGGDLSEDRIVPDIIHSISLGKDILVRNPHSIRPWQHVLEPLYGYLKLAEKMSCRYDELNQSAFNFGPNEDSFIEVKDLVEEAIKTIGNGKWIDVSKIDQPHEANVLKLDIQKAKDILGWEPILRIKETIDWTFSWYKASLANEDMIEFTERQIEEYEEKIK